MNTTYKHTEHIIPRQLVTSNSTTIGTTRNVSRKRYHSRDRLTIEVANAGKEDVAVGQIFGKMDVIRGQP